MYVRWSKEKKGYISCGMIYEFPESENIAEIKKRQNLIQLIIFSYFENIIRGMKYGCTFLL